jgi:steroid 5-alpha reductase family enzyme
MSEIETLLIALISLVLTYSTVWMVQRRTHNAGMIDPVWAFSLGAVALLYGLLGNGVPLTRGLVAMGGMLWGVRLGSHLWRRNAGHPEDARYRELRETWGDDANRRLFWFFQVQAVAALLLSLAFLVPSFLPHEPDVIQIAAAVIIWLLSVGGEALADRQLRQFVADPAHRGHVCRVGLWRYSRHPNYFFECLHWVAYVPLACGAPWAWLMLLPPALMTLLLLKVSGIPLLEAHLAKSRPGYADYVRTTSMLLPLPPRQLSTRQPSKGTDQ